MNKFAFSLVELTVVLLIIGLILAIALKGQIIIESARLRSEIRKIEKLQNSFANYVNRQNKLPPVVPGSTAYDIEALIKDGYIPKQDTLAGIKADNAADGYSWKYFACLNEKGTGDDNYSWKQASVSSNLLLANVCVAMADNTTEIGSMDGLLNCTIEASLDDKNYRGGNGRIKSDSTQPDDIDFDNCNLASGKVVQYLYKIW
jgi:prepilin-type N-terminal cleavage/methylation domain-containing protein